MKEWSRIALSVLFLQFGLASAHAQSHEPNLMLQLQNGTLQDVQAAVKGIADIRTTLIASSDYNSAEYPNVRWTALTWAASSNQRPEVISFLLSAGSDVNAKDQNGITALMVAAEHNENPEIITRLLKAGADVNAADDAGFTPLIHAASKNDNPAVLAALLAAGANAKLKTSKGYTALDYAEYNRSLKDTEAYRQLQKASQ